MTDRPIEDYSLPHLWKLIEEQQQLLELWMLYYTDGMPDDELRDLYCDSIAVLEDD